MSNLSKSPGISDQTAGQRQHATHYIISAQITHAPRHQVHQSVWVVVLVQSRLPQLIESGASDHQGGVELEAVAPARGGGGWVSGWWLASWFESCAWQ